MNAPYHLQLQTARSLFRIKDNDAGFRLLNEIVRDEPKAVEAWMLLAEMNLNQRQYEPAATAALAATKLRPEDTHAHYALGRVHKAMGKLDNAAESYRRAIDLDPRNVNALTSLAILFRSQGRVDEAIELYLGVLALDPNHVEATHNLANALAARDAGNLAVDRAGQAGASSRLRHSAVELVKLGKFADALRALKQALRIEPQAADLWLMAGTLAFELAMPADRLLPFFEEAARLDPKCTVAVEMAYAICFAGGLADLTAHYARLLDETSASKDLLMLRKFFLPAIQTSSASIQISRRLYQQGLDEALSCDYRLEKAPSSPVPGGFLLAYHGENDRDLQIKAAQAWLKLMPDLAQTAPHCRCAQRRGGKIRVGFISNFFAVHSIGNTSRGLIEQLGRERFEVFVLRISPSADDEVTRLICRSADHEVVLDRHLARAREQIAALELDILFYQDVGLEPTSYFLAFARLAHVQCVSFGHPNTTGIPNMDYFVSNDLYETQDAQHHYSERLFLLKDLPTLAYYEKPTRTARSVDRASLGLPENATLYVCPQALFKIHPEFDRMIGGILRSDPRGMLVLISGNFEHWTHLLRARFEQTIPHMASRIVFLPTMNRSVFLELLATSDVILDTLYFNGMNSSLECFAVGAPVVTLPTRFQRGRHTQAMYRKMGIVDNIARTQEEYVDIAVRLGTDRDYASSMRSRILARCDVLFENKEVIEEFERFFLESMREKGFCPAVG